MAKTSNRQLMIRGLLATGWTKTWAKTAKYEIYSMDGTDQLMLVGKSGALRTVKRGDPIARSISLTSSRVQRAFYWVGMKADSCSSVDQARVVFAHYVATGETK
jgi:hypothetical protein